MKKLLLLSCLLIFVSTSILAQVSQSGNTVDTRIDNMGYWNSLAEKGIVPKNPVIPVKEAEFRGTGIKAKSVKNDNSPDVPVTNQTNVTQSENSVFVDPSDPDKVMNSNNSTSWSGGSIGSLYGANYFYSNDYGATWGGFKDGAGGDNSGDPTTAIDLLGRRYVGFIHDNSGQGIAYSDNGVNWTPVLVAGPAGGSGLLDKNHMWIDNSPTSPYENNLYNAWTPFGGANYGEIEIVRSTDRGVSWSSAQEISSNLNAGSHNQGVNIQTGPNGEVYVVWAIYDSWPIDENSFGFAKSTDGGVSYNSWRIINNIRGIRDSETSKNMRVNSFPSMAVDISGGPNNGNIYVVWTNIGFPGNNTGTNRSIYMIRSTDGGSNWSTPIRVNQGPNVQGKEAYFPWITCDPVTGALSVVFYDDRNTSSASCEVFVANSFDAGNTWEDFVVSDVSFTPSPIPGLAGGYMGDYLGISARDGKVYPCWTDNRGGIYMTYVSPFETNNLERPENLTASLNDATGEVLLNWDFNFVSGFQYFNIYRDGVLINTTTNTTYTDNLPDYGLYDYEVTAQHNDGESIPAAVSVQWGDAGISVNPSAFNETLPPDAQATKTMTISNIGELELTYDLNTTITSKSTDACSASGGCDEYISNVTFAEIDNTTGCDNYGDYTSLVANVNAGDTYTLDVSNGNVYSADDLGVWIDWNQDDDFDDSGEEVVCEISNGGYGSFDITIPNDALPGMTTMRIRLKWSGSDCGSPCGTTTYGEVEDYSINVNSWLQVNPTSGTVAAGGSESVDVTFNSNGLAIGVYTAEITINSNDPNNPSTIVPVTLNVNYGGTPEISVNPLSVDYGDIPINSTSTEQFSIENTGTGLLSGIISTPAGYSVYQAKGKSENGKNNLPYSVIGGATAYFDLVFEPTQVQPYNGDVVISHNASGGDVLIAVTGSGIPVPEPDIAVNPASVYQLVMLEGDDVSAVEISNSGDGDLTYSSSISYQSDEAKSQKIKTGYAQKNFETSSLNELSPFKAVGYTTSEAIGDILQTINVQSATGDNQILGCEFDGVHLWFSGRNDDSDNQIYQFNTSGTLLNSYNQGTSSIWGIRDMAFDGNFLYGGDEDGFYRIDPATGAVSTLFTGNLGLGCIRALAYDPNTGHFLACNWDTQIIEFDDTGTQYATYSSPGLVGMYGLAYNDFDGYLWIHDRTGNPETTLYQYDLNTESLTGLSYQVPLLSGLTEQVNGGAFFSSDLVSGKLVIGGLVQGTPDDTFYAMELGDAYSWLTITSNATGTVPAFNGSLMMDLHFDASGLPLGIYDATISISSNDPDQAQLNIPVTMEVVDGILVDLRVYLEGPYFNGQMQRDLNIYGHMPYNQPYNTAPWNYDGTETADPIPNFDVVDWVLVELRETPGDATSATGSTKVAEQAGFLLKNGYVVGIDGSSLLSFPIVVTDNLYAVVWHRNHLGVLSADPLTLSGGVYSYDFSDAADKAYGGALGHKNIDAGLWGMVGGDGNADGQISNFDKNIVWSNQAGSGGYFSGDFNLDIQVDNADKAEIWIPNSGNGSQVPDLPQDGFKCQVPK